jgi:tRNA threonylcarbamoyladenosine biosynthesis protein TsaE
MRADAPSLSWIWFAEPAALEQFGAAVAKWLQPGEAVCLFGALGAGKTTLARGLIRALTDPDQEVPSPTFTLMQTYEGVKFPVAHLDLYRLRRAEEAFEVGLDEALESGAAVVEWSERLDGDLPPDRMEIRLTANRPYDDGGDEAGRGRWAAWTSFGTWREKAFHW